MASIIKKKIKGNIYYYYVESARVNGKPKIINQKYLGTAEGVLKKISNGSLEPLYSKVLDFGDVLLLYDIAARLGVVDIINQCFTKRCQGLSIGDYSIIAAINRAVCPTSDSCVQEWFEMTILTKIMHFNTNLLSPQNYWNNLEFCEGQLINIENTIVKKIIDTYDINTTKLIYDATNFFTYINTKQDCELAKRGHCKAKRNDLKIVGLSMLVSPDHSIPLLYDTYPGNRNDAAEFTVMLNKLRSRYQYITNKSADITVIFDRGNNSENNIMILESNDLPMHYVGGLKRNQCEELLMIPDTEFTQLNGIQNSRSVRRKMEVFGRELTVVTVYNQELFNGQMQGIAINIEKTIQRLTELQMKLIARNDGTVVKGKKPTTASVEKQVGKILSTEYMNELFTYSIKEGTLGGIPLLSFSMDETAFLQLQSTVLGKNVLFTNRHEWTDEEIVSAYRSAWHIEHAFRQMKDTDHLTVRPIFHWTDSKIKTHIFLCVLAYRLCSLLKKELDDAGIHNSLNHILDNMKQYKYVITVIGNNKSDVLTSFTHPNELTSKILDMYNLNGKYLS